MAISQIMVIFCTFFAIYLIYLAGKRFFFHQKNAFRTLADIEKIAVHSIDYLWSPEINIDYSFKYNNKKYGGNDFSRIDDLIDDSYFLLTDQNNLPTLNTLKGKFVGEESIEHYLMSSCKSLLIEFNYKNPNENRIYKVPSRENKNETGQMANYKC